MATRRTRNALALLIADMVDKDRLDTTFIAYVESMLLLTHNEIVAEVPYARWLTNETTLTATVAGTQYVAVPTDFDVDSMVSIRDETNNRRVRKITLEEANRIDPGRDLTGDEILWWFQRVGGVDRIYFLNRPDSVDTLTITFGTNPDDPATGASFALPAKYEPYLMAGALIKVWGRIDPTQSVQLQVAMYSKGLAIIKRDANSNPSEASGMARHRPRPGETGVEGASFPANFDVS